MSETTCHMSISLDGFVAGPDQSLEHPLGRRGMELHHWHLDEPLHDADARARDLLLRPRGAYVMGRNMFGPIRGPWQGDWRGWWGDEPPYHAPVFVLTHYEHEPIELGGGTTFYFVGDGFDAAFARASETAGDRGVDIAGGASTVRQALAAGRVKGAQETGRTGDGALCGCIGVTRQNHPPIHPPVPRSAPGLATGKPRSTEPCQSRGSTNMGGGGPEPVC